MIKKLNFSRKYFKEIKNDRNIDKQEVFTRRMKI